MAQNLKFIPKLALFLLIAAVVTVGAEVKLRIYLQDGTLQAGNLVAENPDTFVILTKEGRAEIKKEKIMFINGKTLKQWQERPDKLFQTEIIPSDIPNPSYVNDKAALPVVPALSDSKPVIKPITKSAVSAASVQPPPEKPKPTPAPTSAAKPTPKPVPSPESVKAQAVSAPVAPVAAPPVIEMTPKVVRKPVPKAVPVVAAVKKEPDPSPAPPRFVRKDFGDYHYQRAQAYLKTGSRGPAIQELHLATVLDRQNPESIFLIGRLYMEGGENIRAEKYFSHPLIRKREPVKKLVEEMNAASKKQEKNLWFLYSGASIGLLAWVPLLIVWRKLKRPSVRVITAETAEEMASEEVLSAPVEQLLVERPRVEKPQAEQPQVEKPTIKQPIIDKLLVGDPQFEKTTAEILKRLQEPPVVPPVPEPVPVSAVVEEPVSSIVAAQNLDTEAMLRVASMVEKAICQGNTYAVEEKYDLARREYRTALALRPTCAEAHLGLGYLCFAQGQWELALEHYVKCMEIDSNSADAHYGIGRVLLETDRINEAVPEFQKTLALDPTFDDARDTLSAIGAGV